MSGAESRKVVAPETNQQTNQPTAESTNNYVGSDVALFDRMLMRHDLKYTLAHINKNTGTGDNMSSFQL